jgi:hypothetical protein
LRAQVDHELADDAVWSEPLSQANFPAIREKYREFRIFEAIQALDQLKSREITVLFDRIP